MAPMTDKTSPAVSEDRVEAVRGEVESLVERDWRLPYRTRDESGTPTEAGTVGWNWIRLRSPPNGE